MAGASAVRNAAEAPLLHVIALSRTAVTVRHWFEIDLNDSSMEHGARIELRELAAHPRRGSESAAQLLTLDRPLWRADLFDRLADAPGSFGAAHYHPKFDGNEPCPRAWDPHLTASPWQWLGEQLSGLGNGSWQLDPLDGRELAGLAGTVVALAQQFAPVQCGSAARCFELTRDASDAVRLMVGSLRRPDLLDADRVAPWIGAVSQ
jgi:hypothetical protein